MGDRERWNECSYFFSWINFINSDARNLNRYAYDRVLLPFRFDSNHSPAWALQVSWPVETSHEKLSHSKAPAIEKLGGLWEREYLQHLLRLNLPRPRLNKSDYYQVSGTKQMPQVIRPRSFVLSIFSLHLFYCSFRILVPIPPRHLPQDHFRFFDSSSSRKPAGRLRN